MSHLFDQAVLEGQESRGRDDEYDDEDDQSFEGPIPHRTPLHSLEYKPLGGALQAPSRSVVGGAEC